MTPHNAWAEPTAGVFCGGEYDPTKGFDPAQAISILQSAGYTWTTEPAGEQAGSGLKGPDGQPVPPISLLVPSDKDATQSVQAAGIVQHNASYLGIPLSVRPVDSGTIRYALFKDRNYDMAIVGWRLSEYPGYLCDWFGDGNPFGYQYDELGRTCQQLE